MGVTKIETVGGTYLCCVGLRESEKFIKDEIKYVPFMNRCVELALSIIDQASMTKLADGTYIQMKVGIHTGPIASGVVGYHKP